MYTKPGPWTDEMVKTLKIKSESPEPICWKKSLAIHVAKCPPPARTVLGGGGGGSVHQKRRHPVLEMIFSSPFQLRALGHVKTQNSHLALQFTKRMWLSKYMGRTHL